jgi:hypothetical protein
MRVADNIHGSRRLRFFVALAALPLLLGGGTISDSRDPLKAGPDSTGSLPKFVSPATPPGGLTSPIKTPTIGCVMDAATCQPIVGALLVVTSSTGEIAGMALTDDDGIFVVYLFDQPGLELAIPSEGLAGLSIEAGDILTIFVP